MCQYHSFSIVKSAKIGKNLILPKIHVSIFTIDSAKVPFQLPNDDMGFSGAYAGGGGFGGFKPPPPLWRRFFFFFFFVFFFFFCLLVTPEVDGRYTCVPLPTQLTLMALGEKSVGVPPPPPAHQLFWDLRDLRR